MRWFWIILALGLALGAVYAGFYFANSVPAKSLAGSERKAGDATVGKGAAEASRDAAEIIHKGEDRDREIDARKERAHEEIDAAPGGDQRLDPALRDAVNRGLGR